MLTSDAATLAVFATLARTCVINLIQRGIRKLHGRLAHGFTSALVPCDGNPTRNGLLI